MEKYLNKLYDIIDKIGKQNFILIIFILVALITTGLYQTFSLYTTSNGVSLIEGINTYSFILNASNTTNSVTIAAGNSKNIDVTVSNESVTNLAYGLYYSSTSDLTDINIGYLSSTTNLPNGTIPGSTNYLVTIKIDNNSSSEVTINFGLKYGFDNDETLGLATDQYWLSSYTAPVLLTTVAAGSYVAYTGNNGCNSTTTVNGYTACSGMNANYVSDTDMGYCNSSSYKFTVNGWRVAYISNGNVYLVSAGAPECLANTISTYEYTESAASDIVSSTSGNLIYASTFTFDSSTGIFSLGSTRMSLDFGDSSNNREILSDYNYTCLSNSSLSCTTLYKVTDSDGSGTVYQSTLAGTTTNTVTLNEVALKYCNIEYAEGGVCDSTTARAIDDSDYEIIVNDGDFDTLSCFVECNDSTCEELGGANYKVDCGRDNDLISNGGTYWFNKNWGTDFYYWNPEDSNYGAQVTNVSPAGTRGVRPILVLDSEVRVVSGTGTYADPYVISN